MSYVQEAFDFYADRPLTIQERFEKFDQNNPHVYRHLVRLAGEAHEAGARAIGIKMIWEVMRWQVFMQTRDPSGLKLNNNYHSRYVRKLITDHPELEALFELRALQTP